MISNYNKYLHYSFIEGDSIDFDRFMDDIMPQRGSRR